MLRSMLIYNKSHDQVFLLYSQSYSQINAVLDSADSFIFFEVPAELGCDR